MAATSAGQGGGQAPPRGAVAGCEWTGGMRCAGMLGSWALASQPASLAASPFLLWVFGGWSRSWAGALSRYKHRAVKQIGVQMLKRIALLLLDTLHCCCWTYFLTHLVLSPHSLDLKLHGWVMLCACFLRLLRLALSSGDTDVEQDALRTWTPLK